MAWGSLYFCSFSWLPGSSVVPLKLSPIPIPLLLRVYFCLLPFIILSVRSSFRNKGRSMLQTHVLGNVRDLCSLFSTEPAASEAASFGGNKSFSPSMQNRGVEGLPSLKSCCCTAVRAGSIKAQDSLYPGTSLIFYF